MAIAKQIDYMDALISISGVTLFMVGLLAGGYQFSWTSAKVLASLIIGIVLIILFVVWELWGTRSPMVLREIFGGQRIAALAYAIVFVAGKRSAKTRPPTTDPAQRMNFYSILGFFPLILQYSYQTTPMHIGVRALCYPIATLGGPCIAFFLMSYTRGLFERCSPLLR